MRPTPLKKLQTSALSLAMLACPFFSLHALEGFYIKAEGGFAYTQSPKAQCSEHIDWDVSIQARNVHTGTFLPIGLALGYRLNSNWRTELSFNSRSHLHYRLQDDRDGTASGQVHNRTVMANLNYDIGTYHQVIPYIGLGLGLSMNKTDAATWSTPDDDNSTEGGKRTHQLAWALQLGATRPLNDSLSIGLSYRYIHLGGFRNSGEFSDGTPGACIRFHSLKAHELLLSLTYEL